MTSRKRLLISLAILLAVFWVGVFGYVLIGRLVGSPVSFFDAIYMVAITIPTVGYQEAVPNLVPFKAWTICVVLFGVSTAAVALSSVTGLFVEGEMGRLIGSKKVESRIKQLNHHVIMCGFGRMGDLLARQLIERHVPMVIVERDPERCRVVEELGQLYLVGDASEEKTLEQAGIARARSLVAVLTSDADNVFVTLTARQMRPDLTIIARAEQTSSERKLRHAGANRVIATQAIGAERIANLLTRPHVTDFVDVAAQGIELEVGELRVSGDSPIAGKSLLESNIRKLADLMVVAIRRADGTFRFNPGANETLQPDDHLITIGPTGALTRLQQMTQGQEKT